MGTEWESFGFLARRISQSCQNCSPCDQRSSWNKMIVSKRINFESFSRDLAKEKHNSDSVCWFGIEKFLTLANVFGKGVKTEIYVTSKTFWEKNSLEEDRILYISMVLPRKSRFAVKLHFRQEGILGVQRNFPKHTFLEETKLFKLLGSERECFWFLMKQKRQKCQNCMPCVQKNTLNQKVFLRKKNNISTLFADFEWKNSRLWPNFSTKVSKLIFMCPVGLFEKSFLGRSCNFIPSYVFSEEKLIFKCPGLSRRLFRCPAEHSGRQFSRSKNYLYFLGSEWESFGFLSKRIWQSCQNCSPCDQRSSWNKMISFQNKSTSNRFPET